MARKTIGIIGTIISDFIQPYSREGRTSYGGIFYTLLYLANIFDHNWRIVPVARIGEDIYDSVIAKLNCYKNIETTCLIKDKRENTRVHITYFSATEREERTTEPMAPLQWQEVKTLVNYDILLVNFITGCEIELPTLLHLSDHARGLIYEDYHSLALGIDESGNRYRRRDPDWQHWTGAAHIIQMNEYEAATLLEIQKLPYPLDKKKIGDMFLQGKTEVCIFTLGEKGAYLNRKVIGHYRAIHIAPHRIDRFVDPTGCGDAFAAGFLCEYIKSTNIEKSARYANIVAGLNCTITGTDYFDRLKNNPALLEN